MRKAAALLAVPLGATLGLCYLYALWIDLRAASFFRFALDFTFFPAGIAHGAWGALVHLL